jgi:cell division initiation protein
MVIITPIEIRNKKFERSFRGYNVDDVNAFLHSVAHTWSKINDDVVALKQELQDNKNEINRLLDIENSLLKIINNAKDTSASIIENAKEKANVIIDRANLEALSIIENANKEHENIIENAKKDAAQTRDELSVYKDYKRHIIKELESVAHNITAHLNSLRNEDMSE